MGFLPAGSLLSKTAARPLPFKPLSVHQCQPGRGGECKPVTDTPSKHSLEARFPSPSPPLASSYDMPTNDRLLGTLPSRPVVHSAINVACRRVGGRQNSLSCSWQRGMPLSGPRSPLVGNCDAGRRRRRAAGFRVRAQGNGSEGGKGKDGEERGPGSGSFMDGSQEPGKGSGKGSGRSQEQDTDEFVDDLQKAFDSYRQGDIELMTFVSLIVRAFLQDSTTHDFFKSTDWYDVDGNQVTEWTQERIDTVLQAKIGVVLEGMLGLQMSNSVRRVDWMMEKELRQTVFANSPFSVTAVEQGIDGSRCFYGELTGDPEETYRVLTQRLAAHYPDLVLVLSQEAQYETPTCRVAYKDTLVITPGVTRELGLASIVLVIICANSLLRTDPALITGGAALWNGLLFPLGLLVLMVSSYVGQALCSLAYRVPVSPFYLPLPAPGLGLVGLPWKDKCLLPNRACLIDQALASSAATCFTSFALMATDPPPVPFYLRLLASDFGWTEAPGALRDVVLIDAGTFQYSAVMSEFASHLSRATYQLPSGEALLAVGPFALAGLVGLNMTALNLAPFGMMHGGRIINGIGGGTILLICSFLTAALVIILSLANITSFWPWFGLGIAFVGVSAYESQRNELSPPGPWRSMLGLGCVGMGAFTLLPSAVFYSIFSTGPGILVEQVGAALSLFPIP